MKHYDSMIIGGYGVGNIGDEAILSGMLQKLRERGKDRIVVVSHTPDETESLHNVEAIPPRMPEIVKYALLSKEIRIGGGGLFSKYIGPYAKKIPYFAIFCKLLGKRVHWDAIGIYPSAPQNIHKLLKLALKLSDSVTVRDNIALKFVSNVLGVQTSLVPDYALYCKPSSSDVASKILDECGVDLEKKKIGIAPIYSIDYTNRLKQVYIDFIRAIPSDIEIVLIPFCKHKYEPIEMDHILAHEIKNSLKSRNNIHIIDRDLTPSDVLSIVGKMDFFIATRLHSAIFAYLSGVKFIDIMYLEQCEAFLESVGLKHYGIKINEVSAELLLRFAKNVLEL